MRNNIVMASCALCRLPVLNHICHGFLWLPARPALCSSAVVAAQPSWERWVDLMRASLWRCPGQLRPSQTAGPWPHLPWLSWLPALQHSAQSAAAAAQPAHKYDILLHWLG